MRKNEEELDRMSLSILFPVASALLLLLFNASVAGGLQAQCGSSSKANSRPGRKKNGCNAIRRRPPAARRHAPNPNQPQVHPPVSGEENSPLTTQPEERRQTCNA